MGEQQAIACRVCGTKVHTIHRHLSEGHHPGMDIEQYKSQFPDAPLLSEAAKQKLAERGVGAERIAAAAGASTASMAVVGGTATKLAKPFHEVFGFEEEGDALNLARKPIPITVVQVVGPDGELVPDVNANHVFDILLTKHVVIGLEMNMPILLWGHTGTGKTTTALQVCARTGRPTLRIQHTLNTEEAHVTGQWTMKGGETHFQPGPLAQAMRNGWVYLADEYDFGLASVLSVYQPVLEGNPLVIKDAPAEWRIVKPHPNFRFIATGNTNGSGDDTGLYQGTQPQNHANYERFLVTEQVKYMAPELEVAAIMKQAHPVNEKQAKQLVEFANNVRQSYANGTLTVTVSLRALIAAGKLGLLKGSMVEGLKLAFMNKLGKVDREAVGQYAQRVFGGTV